MYDVCVRAKNTGLFADMCSLRLLWADTLSCNVLYPRGAVQIRKHGHSTRQKLVRLCSDLTEEYELLGRAVAIPWRFSSGKTIQPCFLPTHCTSSFIYILTQTLKCHLRIEATG